MLYRQASNERSGDACGYFHSRKALIALRYFRSRKVCQVRHATSFAVNAKISSLQRSMYSERKCQFVYASLLGGDHPREEPVTFAVFHM